ncbi:MAG: DUF1553 domain-containing protein [Bryobacteraceae bacterium]|nr:DUF1553 domain-containing protein [Bryobacteraceae bacterium]
MKDRTWVKSPVDAFVLQRLNQEQIPYAKQADRRALARRVYLDVAGLPPTLEQTAAFVNDRSPKAWATVVDHLLASPGYGERWAQHWLDVVRFAESDGFEYDTHRSNAWEYRDYIIRSFQEDKPYDQFIREQLAGDEMDASKHELLVASSFNRLGPYRKNAGNQDEAFIRNEVLTEMTNVVGSAFLGVTLGCARCHDHKFDPLRQKDYYRIQAFFSTTQLHDVPLASAEEQKRWEKKTAEAKKELADLKAELKTLEGVAKSALERIIGEKEKLLPDPLPFLQTVRHDPARYVPVHVLERGSASAPGDKVGMRPLGVLLPDESLDVADRLKQPRLALANWIAAPDNPLTARVLVNRIWQSHFGTGLVATANDFGRMGTYPSHPELLDFLANEFVQNGMRMKPIHRMILLSSTYQQASVAGSAKELDVRNPQNKLLAGFPRRRLDAEQLRDTMLAASGILNRRLYGPSVFVPIEAELTNLLYKPSQWAVTPDAAEHVRRSLYLFHKRNMRVPFLEVFDSPDTLLSCARRESSTHAPQGLELLNGTLMQQASVALAEKLKREAGSSRQRQIQLAFQLACGRPPTAAEHNVSARFLASNPLREFALAIFASNDFLYIQ